MNILLLDTETVAMASGSRYPAMCQIGMIRGTIHMNELDVTVLGELDQKLNPEVPASEWQEDAIAITGIRPEDVANEPTFFEAYHDIYDMACGSRILVGYNVEFDVNVIAAALRRYGLEHHFPWPREHVDVMKLSADRFPAIAGKRGNKYPTLSEAYAKLMGEELKDAHDAMADIRATLEVYRKCIST